MKRANLEGVGCAQYRHKSRNIIECLDTSMYSDMQIKMVLLQLLGKGAYVDSIDSRSLEDACSRMENMQTGHAFRAKLLRDISSGPSQQLDGIGRQPGVSIFVLRQHGTLSPSKHPLLDPEY